MVSAVEIEGRPDVFDESRNSPSHLPFTLTYLLKTKDDSLFRLIASLLQKRGIAAVDGKISFPRLPEHEESVLEPEIVGVHLHYETEDVFGAITGGHLTVRSCLHRVLLSPLEDPEHNRWMKRVQVLRSDGHGNDGAILESVIHENAGAYGSFDEEFDPSDPDSRKNLYCIPRDSINYHWFYLLILQLIDLEEAHYARRGVVIIFLTKNDKRETLLKTLQTPSDRPSLRYHCIAYEDGKHTIRLV